MVIVELSWFPGAIVREEGEAEIVNVGRLTPSALLHVTNRIEVSRHRQRAKRHSADVFFIEISAPLVPRTRSMIADLTFIQPVRGK